MATKDKVNGMELDLSAFDTSRAAEAGFTLQLRHPIEDTPLPATIELVGADSQTYQRRARALQRARAQEIARTRKVRVSPDEIEADAIELLAVSTRGWQHISLNGAPFEFNEGNARRLYRDYPWIREQVDQAVHNRANFIPTSTQN